MASIIADHISLVFPLIGSDTSFSSRLSNKNQPKDTPVGGEITIHKSGKAGIAAIQDFSIQLKDGDRLGIFGHNGAGKSTLLRMLGGIYPPTSGKISISGRVSGMFSLGLGINKDASGYENIKLKGLMYGLKRREIQEMVPEIVEFSGLGDYLHMPVKIYSAGMTLRLMFSVASVLKPDILLLDEWISSSDKQFRRRMDERLEKMLEETPIVVIASHNEARLHSWSNKTITLKNGRILPESDLNVFPPAHGKFRPNPSDLEHFTRLINFNKLEEALSFLGTVWPIENDPGNYHSRHANLFSKMKKYDQSLTSYHKALELDPKNVSLHNQIAKVLTKTKEYHAAITHLEQALSASKGTVGNILLYEETCNLLGNPKRAKKFLCQLNNKIQES